MTTVDTAIIDQPGVYDLPADIYHRDPVPGGSLSSTGARKLLPPSCPAKYRWWADHPEPPKKAWDIGHAAHSIVLGFGPQLVRIEGTGVDPEAWRTNDDKAAVADARACGAVPLKPAEWDQVHAMADALRQDPVARALLDPDRTYVEQSYFWRDQPTGLWCRARPDVAHFGPRRTYVVDYKTAESAEPGAIEKANDRWGYEVQGAHYLNGFFANQHVDPDLTAYLLLVQEKTPPYLVTVAELAADAKRAGQQKVRRALDVYADCVASGHWPGYASDVVYVSLPTWSLIRHAEEYA